MLHRVALVRTDVSEELSASFIRAARIGELETTLAVASNLLILRRRHSFQFYPIQINLTFINNQQKLLQTNELL
jgi:hypothetical protein